MLVAEVLVLLIPLVAVLYHLSKFAPTIYDWLEKRRVYRLYSELKRLEDEMLLTAPSGIRNDFIVLPLDFRSYRFGMPKVATKVVLLNLRVIRQRLFDCIRSLGGRTIEESSRKE